MSAADNSSPKRRLIFYFLPIAVLAAAWGISQIIKANEPQAERRTPPPSALSVEAIRLLPGHYPVVLYSQGTVMPSITDVLTSEVGGRVTWINPSFVQGSDVYRNDVLLRVDKRDFEIALSEASATLAQAEAELLEQRALAAQAKTELKLLGGSDQPSTLALREPQLAAAVARRDAASAQLALAKLNLQRTEIKSPYQGKLSERQVEMGQSVLPGERLGKVYSVESFDVRLPLSDRQLKHLPPVLSDEIDKLTVEINAEIAGDQHQWIGELIRIEGLDQTTQQLNVIARVPEPMSQSDMPLRVNQFVQARIYAASLEQVFVIPRSALREEREVLLVDDQHRIYRQTVVLAWSDEQMAAVESGLDAGDLLITTALGSVAEGTPVSVSVNGEALPADSKRADRKSDPESIN